MGSWNSAAERRVEEFPLPSGGSKVARRETSGSDDELNGALEAREEVWAHLQCAI